MNMDSCEGSNLYPKYSAPKLPTSLPRLLFYPAEEDGAYSCFVAESVKALEDAGVRNTVFMCGLCIAKGFICTKPL